MTDFGGLPDHIQIMVVGTVITVGSVWGVIKFIKPFIDHLTPKQSEKTTDAVVISAALADSKNIADLKNSIEKLISVQAETNVINRMMLDAMHRLIHKP